ncbi:MAG: hypothetical protein H6834_17380 [Planctomycetes bacterium]|nr:hypothetical protein [Planctomycetota bacterium]
MKPLAGLATSLLSLLPLACQTAEPVVLSLDGRVDRLAELDPVDVVVLPVSSTDPSIAAPYREMEEAIREQLLAKRYSVLAREAVLARARPNGGLGEPVSYEPGASQEDAVLEVQIHGFDVPKSGPIRKVAVDASFKLVGTDPAQTVFWERRHARAEIRTDSLEQKTLMTRGEVQVEAIEDFVELVFRELPEKARLSTLTESTATNIRPD